MAATAPAAPAPTSAAPPAPLRGRALVERERGYPRATLFRTAVEVAARRGTPIQDVVAMAKDYDMVLAKALDEEIVGLVKAAPYLQAIKARYPTKIVLDHFLFEGRNPLSAQPSVFPGHWLLLNGTTLTADLSASETTLRVANGALVLEGEAVQITALDAGGKPDWSKVEQIRVKSVSGDRVTVDRGQFGSSATAFKAGAARVAAHAYVTYSENTIWKYNFCLESPRDAQGRRLVDALARTLADYIAPGGVLAGIDGYQFDVARFSTGSTQQRTRRLDCDNDGEPDSGYANGRSSYGLGAASFFTTLRSLVGDDVLLLSEATGGLNERSITQANGIEIESFPDLHAWDHFSASFQRYRYWVENARAPRLSFLQLKETAEAFTRCADRDKGTNWRYRLAIAAALMGDGYFAWLPIDEDDAACSYRHPTLGYAYAEPDELTAGRDGRWGYLGQALEQPRRVDRGAGVTVLSADFEATAGVTIALQGKSSATSALDRERPGGGASSLRITVTAIDPDPNDGRVRASLAPMRVQKDREYAISLKVRADTGYGKVDPTYAALPRKVSFDVLVGGKQAPTPAQAAPLLDVMADATWRQYVLSFVAPADDAAATVRIALGTEPGDVWLDDVRVSEGGPDLFVRRFENGVVLLNATAAPHAFDLARLFPGVSLRRIDGAVDRAVNTGQPVSGTVTVPARDALILLAAGR